MKKLPEQQLKLLFLLVIVVVLAGAFQFGYMNFHDRTVLLEEENLVLENRVSDLKLMVLQEENFRKGIEENLTMLDEILAKYGAGNTPQKSTQFVIQLEDAAKVEIPSISFGDETMIFTSAQEYLKTGLTLYGYQSNLHLTYRTTYEGLKQCMDYINTYPERMNVENLTASYDIESGNLSGTMMINLFAVTGTEKQYENPKIDQVPTGVNNIFGTAELPIR